MANFGRTNTNNSQFVITTVECPHLDGTNVVFGRVIKGLAVVNEMETFATDEGKTTKNIEIADCGEILENTDWQYCDDDGTPDKLPPFPSDWDDLKVDRTLKEKLQILNVIKESGNTFYRAGDYLKSARKYKKVSRYFNFFKDNTTDDEGKKALDTFQLVNLTNLAATELKLNEFNDVRHSCNAAIKIDKNNSKAFYRRGVANLELKNYEMALDDLKMAHKLVPTDKDVLKQFEKAKKLLLAYRRIEKENYKRLFV
jgi:peptidyl-prolyl isomerase D